MSKVKLMRVDEWVEKSAKSFPEKIAIKFKNQSLKYKELISSVEETAAFLQQECKLLSGDRVAYYGPNNPEIVILILAASKIGVIIVPLNWRLAVPEIKFLLDNSTPKVVLFDPVFKSNYLKIINNKNKIISIPIINDNSFGLALSLRRKNFYGSLRVKNNSLDLLLVYTSGTTGRPKGAVLSNKSVICNSLMSHHAHSMDSKDSVFICLPLFHVGGINILFLPALFIGAKTFLEEKFDQDSALKLIESEKITQFITVPKILNELLKSKLWNVSDLSSLKNISVGSTDVPVELINKVQKKNVPVIQIYGATETSPLAIYQTSEMAFNSVGSIGTKGLYCSIKLVNEKLKKVKTGHSGEILVKGDNVLSYYWKDKEATKTNIVDGWFRTGDIARVDEQGYYWFLDRIKNVIISGGENIYPAELERILKTLNNIPEFSIVGKKDPDWGEVPVIAIKKQNNTYSKGEIIDYFVGKVAKYKIPKDVIFVNDLPKNALGKILVNEVKKIVFNSN